MSGTAIIRYLLANHAGLTALVPATRIMAGILPIEGTMPAISVRQITGNQNNTLGMNEAAYLVTHRVQVTVFAKDVDGDTDYSGYERVKTILAQVRAACPQTYGTTNGVDCDSIYPDTEGPDLYDPESLLYSQSQDFMVSFRR